MTEGRAWQGKLSFSSASRYRKCPRDWAFRYIARIEDPPTVATVNGNFVHRVRELEPLPDVTLDRLRVRAREVWDTDFYGLGGEYTDALLSLGLDETGLKRLKGMAWRCIERSTDPEAHVLEPLSLEEKVDLELYGVPFLGFIDRKERHGKGVAIRDWKSGKRKEPKPQYNEAKYDHDQPLVYAAAVAQSTGEKITHAGRIYLGGERAEVVAAPLSEMTAAVERLRDTYEDIQKSVETGVFPAQPQALCRWCSNLLRCSKGMNRVLGDLAKYDDADPGPYGGQLVELWRANEPEFERVIHLPDPRWEPKGRPVAADEADRPVADIHELQEDEEPFGVRPDSEVVEDLQSLITRVTAHRDVRPRLPQVRWWEAELRKLGVEVEPWDPKSWEPAKKPKRRTKAKAAA